MKKILGLFLLFRPFTGLKHLRNLFNLREVYSLLLLPSVWISAISVITSLIVSGSATSLV